MFDWLGDILSGMGDAVSSTFGSIGEQISTAIWNTMIQWFYETIYGAVADFFSMMGGMGAEIFDLDWVSATIKLFTLFGWTLYIAGLVVAVFDVAIEYQSGRALCRTSSRDPRLTFRRISERISTGRNRKSAARTVAARRHQAYRQETLQIFSPYRRTMIQ